MNGKNRRFLSPLLALFLIASLALPSQSACDQGSRFMAAGSGAASYSRSQALRGQEGEESAGLEELKQAFRNISDALFSKSPNKSKPIAAGLEEVGPALQGLLAAYRSGTPVEISVDSVTPGRGLVVYYTASTGARKSGWLPSGRITLDRLESPSVVQDLLPQLGGSKFPARVLQVQWRAGTGEPEVVFWATVSDIRKAIEQELPPTESPNTQDEIRSASANKRSLTVVLEGVRLGLGMSELTVRSPGARDSVVVRLPNRLIGRDIKSLHPDSKLSWLLWQVGRRVHLVVVGLREPSFGRPFDVVGVSVSEREIRGYLKPAFEELNRMQEKEGSIPVEVVYLKLHLNGAAVRFNGHGGILLGFLPNSQAVDGKLSSHEVGTWLAATEEDGVPIPARLHVQGQKHGQDFGLIFVGLRRPEQLQPKTESFDRLLAARGTRVEARILSVVETGASLLYRDPSDRTWYEAFVPTGEGFSTPQYERPFERSTVQSWLIAHQGQTMDFVPTEIREGVVRTAVFHLPDPEKQVGQEIRPTLDELEDGKRAERKFDVFVDEVNDKRAIVYYEPAQGLRKRGRLPLWEVHLPDASDRTGAARLLRNARRFGRSIPVRVKRVNWRESGLDAEVIFRAEMAEIRQALPQTGLEEPTGKAGVVQVAEGREGPPSPMGETVAADSQAVPEQPEEMSLSEFGQTRQRFLSEAQWQYLHSRFEAGAQGAWVISLQDSYPVYVEGKPLYRQVRQNLRQPPGVKLRPVPLPVQQWEKMGLILRDAFSEEPLENPNGLPVRNVTDPELADLLRNPERIVGEIVRRNLGLPEDNHVGQMIYSDGERSTIVLFEST